MKHDVAHRPITILDDAEAVAGHVAGWLAAVLGERPHGTLAVCLAGGSTPRTLYRLLARPPWRDALPWSRLHWFWGDERFVPGTDPRSNFGMVADALLDHVPAPKENVHPIPTGAPTPEAAAAAYEQALVRYYGSPTLDPARPFFDATILGVGEDGHTASLFPGSAALEERTRWTCAVTNAMPEARITLTCPVLEASRNTAFVVTGAAKRDVLQKIFADDSALPAARLRPAGRVHWFVDREAAPR
jgi:6-phosphogluconolactonase